MRRLIVLALVLAPASLRAQPAPDAPVAAHVAHLLRSAQGGFRDLRAPGNVPASAYAMRFRGATVASELTVNFTWNVMHASMLPVQGERSAVPAAWTSVADSIKAVIPAGWREVRTPGEQPHVFWSECANGGRQVALGTTLPFQSPGLTLIVYRFDAPCEPFTP
jgi:hypothetical protein